MKTVDISPHRHRWNIHQVARLAATESLDGNARTERFCELCHMVKITVHPDRGYPWREWRTAKGKAWVGESTPPCLCDAETKSELESVES